MSDKARIGARGGLWVRFGGWVLARGRAHGGTLLALFAVTMLVSLTLAGLSSYLAGATAAGVRQTLDAKGLSGRAVQIGTGLAADPLAQAAAAERLFAGLFADRAVVSDRSVTTGRLPVDHPGTPAGLTMSFGSFDRLDSRVRVVQGGWPASRSGSVMPVALLGSAAAAAGFRLGDLIVVHTDTVPVTGRLTAVLELIEPGDAIFYAEDPAPAGVVGASDLAALGVSLQVRWTIGVDEGALTPAGLARLQPQLGGLRRAVNNDVAVNTGGVHQSGDLTVTVAEINAGVLAAASVTPVTPTLVTAIGFVAILTSTRLLTASRRDGLLLLCSRGIGSRQLVGAAAAEAALVSTSAAGVGVGCAAIVLSINGFPVDSGWWLVLVAGLVVGVVAMAAGSALAEVRRYTSVQNVGRVRARTVAGLGSAVLLFAAAGVALWRFRRLGSAVTTLADGPARVDPVAVMAPALCLIGVALLATAAAGAATTAISTIRRSRGLGVLTWRRVARRWSAFGTVGVVIAVACAGSVTAAAFDRTWNEFSVLVTRLANAADVRVVLPEVAAVGAGAPDPAAALRHLPSVDAAVDALVTPTTAGTGTIELMALPVEEMPKTFPAAPGGFDPPAAQRALNGGSTDGAGQPGGTAPPAGASAAGMVAEGTTAIEVQLEVVASSLPAAPASGDSSAAAPTSVGMSLVVWLSGRGGYLVPIDLGRVQLAVPVAAPGGLQPGAKVRRTLQASVPVAGSGGWRIAAVDGVVDGSATDTVVSVDVLGIETSAADGRSSAVAVSSSQAWSVQQLSAVDAGLNFTARGPGHIGFGGNIPEHQQDTVVRLMPGGGDVAPVPVVVNGDLARQLGLSVGDDLDLQLEATNRYVHAVVARVSPLLPGAAGRPRVLADLGSVLAQLLRTTTTIPAVNQVWLRTSEPRAVAAGAAGVAGAGAVVVPVGSDVSAAIIRPAAVGLWAAAAVAVAVAILALLTLAVTDAGDRRGEATVLWAAGLPRRRQVRSRRVELLAVTLVALALGSAGGVLVSMLTVPGLARSAVVASPDLTPRLVFASQGLWLPVAVLAGAVSVALWYGAAVGRQIRPDGTSAVTG